MGLIIASYSFLPSILPILQVELEHILRSYTNEFPLLHNLFPQVVDLDIKNIFIIIYINKVTVRLRACVSYFPIQCDQFSMFWYSVCE